MIATETPVPVTHFIGSRHTVRSGEWAGEAGAVIGYLKHGNLRFALDRYPGMNLLCGDENLLPAVIATR